MRKLRVGLQLYTLRELTSRDFKGTLAEVSRLGYRGVELAGYGGLSAIELKSVLDELGLEPIGSHVSIERLTDALDEEIAYNKTIGNTRLIMPYLVPEARRHADDWRSIAERLDAIGRKCAAQGMTLLYHNHEFELTDQVDGKTVLDALYDIVPAEELQFELDVCWIRYADHDPAAYINRYAGRVPLVHLKDLQVEEDGKPLTVELGTGVVDLKACIRAAAEAGAEWLVVEQDYCQNPPLQSIGTSMKWIQQFAESGGEVNV